MITTTNLKLDTVRPNINPLVWAKVGDQNSRYVVIAVAENGVTKVIPSTATVSLSMQRSDGAINSVIGTVTEGGYAQIILPQWLTSLSGLCQACVKISEDGGVLHTLNFQIYVEESSSPDKQIIWINYQAPLSAGTYYLIHNEASLSFTTRTILPIGGIVVLNSNLTVTTYEDQSATLPIDIDLPIVNDSIGTFLPAETLIGQLCQDATATAADIIDGKTAYGPNGKIVGTYQPSLIEKTITENGIYNASADNADGYSKVTVDIAPPVNKLALLTQNETPVELVASDLAGCTQIRANAFMRCSNLISVQLPSTIISIGTAAFQSTSNLEYIELPSALMSIGSNAFADSGLLSVEVPAGTLMTSTGIFTNCIKLERAVIGSGITDLGQYTFKGCSLITYIELPDTITTIWNEAFNGCTSLESITLPQYLSQLWGTAFYNCTNLRSITLPATLDIVRSFVFANCTALESVTLLRTASRTALEATSAFQNTTCNIYVPAALVDSYKSATNWSALADRIYAIPE